MQYIQTIIQAIVYQNWHHNDMIGLWHVRKWSIVRFLHLTKPAVRNHLRLTRYSSSLLLNYFLFCWGGLVNNEVLWCKEQLALLTLTCQTNARSIAILEWFKIKHHGKGKNDEWMPRNQA